MAARGTLILAALLPLAAAWAQPADVQELYAKGATWQETWQAATDALARLEAQEAADRAGQAAPEGVVPGPWHLIGSFSNADHKQFATAYPPEKELDFDACYEGMSGSEARWRPGDRLIDGQVIDLHQHFTITEGAIAYLHRVLKAQEACEVALYLGSDDGLAVFLNGERIHANDVPRGPAPDQDVLRAKLKAGDNDLLLKIVNRTGGWGYYFSLKPFAGQGGEPPEHERRVSQLWAMVRRDFDDPALLQQMDWETSDRVWEAFGRPVPDGALSGRYRGAAGARLDRAGELIVWVAADDPQRPVEALQRAVEETAQALGGETLSAARESYYRARRLSEVLAGQYELSCARLAIDDLAATYSDRYPRADGFRGRVAALLGEGEALLTEGDASGLGIWRQSVAALKREALVTNNPLVADRKSVV